MSLIALCLCTSIAWNKPSSIAGVNRILVLIIKDAPTYTYLLFDQFDLEKKWPDGLLKKTNEYLLTQLVKHIPKLINNEIKFDSSLNNLIPSKYLWGSREKESWLTDLSNQTDCDTLMLVGINSVSCSYDYVFEFEYYFNNYKIIEYDQYDYLTSVSMELIRLSDGNMLSYQTQRGKAQYKVYSTEPKFSTEIVPTSFSYLLQSIYIAIDSAIIAIVNEVNK